MAMAHHLAGRHESAIDWASRAIHRMPDWYIGHFLLIAAQTALGREAQARASARRCLDCLPAARVADLDRAPLKDPAEMARLRDALRRAGPGCLIRAHQAGTLAPFPGAQRR